MTSPLHLHEKHVVLYFAKSIMLDSLVLSLGYQELVLGL